MSGGNDQSGAGDPQPVQGLNGQPNADPQQGNAPAVAAAVINPHINVYHVGDEVEFHRKSSDRWYQATVTDILPPDPRLPFQRLAISLYRRGKSYTRIVRATPDTILPLERHIRLCRLGRDVEIQVTLEGAEKTQWVQGTVSACPSGAIISAESIRGNGAHISVSVQYYDSVSQIMKEVTVSRKDLRKFGTHLIPEEEKFEVKEDDDFSKGVSLSASGEVDDDPLSPAAVEAPEDAKEDVPPEYLAVEKDEAGEMDPDEHLSGGNGPSSGLDNSPSPSPNRSKNSSLKKGYAIAMVVGDVIELHRPSRQWVQASINRLGKHNMIVEFMENGELCRRKVPVSSEHIATLGTHTQLTEEVGELHGNAEFRLADHVEILRHGKWVEAVIARIGRRNALVEFYEEAKQQRRKIALTSNSIAPLGTHLKLEDFDDVPEETQKWDFRYGDLVEIKDLNGTWIQGTVRRKGVQTFIIEYFSGQVKSFKKVSRTSRFIRPLGFKRVLNQSSAKEAPKIIKSASAESKQEDSHLEPAKVISQGVHFSFTIEDHKYDAEVEDIRVGKEIVVKVAMGEEFKKVVIPFTESHDTMLGEIMEQFVPADYDVPPEADDAMADDPSMPPPSYGEQ